MNTGKMVSVEGYIVEGTISPQYRTRVEKFDVNFSTNYGGWVVVDVERISESETGTLSFTRTYNHVTCSSVRRAIAIIERILDGEK